MSEALDPDCRFLCPVDEAHPKNRETLTAAGPDEFSLDLHLFKEPWSASDLPLASGRITFAALVEGQDTKVRFPLLEVVIYQIMLLLVPKNLAACG